MANTHQKPVTTVLQQTLEVPPTESHLINVVMVVVVQVVVVVRKVVLEVHLVQHPARTVQAVYQV
jgi:hypothetical protein